MPLHATGTGAIKAEQEQAMRSERGAYIKAFADELDSKAHIMVDRLAKAYLRECFTSDSEATVDAARSYVAAHCSQLASDTIRIRSYVSDSTEQTHSDVLADLEQQLVALEVLASMRVSIDQLIDALEARVVEYNRVMHDTEPA